MMKNVKYGLKLSPQTAFRNLLMISYIFRGNDALNSMEPSSLPLAVIFP